MPITLDFSSLGLMDALDLAILIEAEAWERYNFFSRQIGYRHAGDAASIFVTMAKNEEKHGMQLRDQRLEMFGEAPLRVSRDDIFDVEAPEQGAPRWNMSPLAALQLALSSEQKAWSFYNDALEHVTDPDIRKLFEELRDEELEHIQMVEQAIESLPEGTDKALDDEDR